MQFTLTDDSISFLWKGDLKTVRKDSPNYRALIQAVMDGDEAGIQASLSVGGTLESWLGEGFRVEGDSLYCREMQVDPKLYERILQMVSEGHAPTALLAFWRRLMDNPSNRSVMQLFPFMCHNGIPLLNVGDPNLDGKFLAYKGVTDDFLDIHTKTLSNRVGATHQMARNLISDDPRTPCHRGLHVGSYNYARDFARGGWVMICLIDPKDVVCVPYDANAQKMRVCKYQVVGTGGGHLHNLVVGRSDLPFLFPQEATKHKEEAPPLETTPVEDPQEPQEAPQGAAPAPEAPKPSPEPLEAPQEPQSPYSEEWDEMDQCSIEALGEFSIAQLRRYASNRLHLTGASKIPGGKSVLLLHIEARRTKQG